MGSGRSLGRRRGALEEEPNEVQRALDVELVEASIYVEQRQGVVHEALVVARHRTAVGWVVRFGFGFVVCDRWCAMYVYIWDCLWESRNELVMMKIVEFLVIFCCCIVAYT